MLDVGERYNIYLACKWYMMVRQVDMKSSKYAA
uniref:Uncharacterized protein n=1 Tax=Rhizophora mucronata TaxID=61149 RepID=A0A2P2NFE5_RHIMU